MSIQQVDKCIHMRVCFSNKRNNIHIENYNNRGNEAYHEGNEGLKNILKTKVIYVLMT